MPGWSYVFVICAPPSVAWVTVTSTRSMPSAHRASVKYAKLTPMYTSASPSTRGSQEPANRQVAEEDAGTLLELYQPRRFRKVWSPSVSGRYWVWPPISLPNMPW